MADDAQDESIPLVADWVPLPAAKELSLWEVLHDSQLERISLDRLQRSMVMEFDVTYVRKFHHLPETTRFHLQFSGVKSIRVSETAVWPGEFSIPQDTPWELSEEMRSEHHAKSIEESISWSEFQDKFAAENGTTEVYEATLTEGTGSVELRLFMHVNDDFYPYLIVQGELLAISMNTGDRLSVEEFLALGESYWAAFAERGRKLRAASESIPVPD